MSKVALIISLPIFAGCATTIGWRDLRIDGSNQSSFEESVALVRNELPSRRRDRFEAALAVIWIQNTVELNAGDLDNDGDLDPNDLRGLKAIAVDVQRDIQRGTLLSATEEREENYFKQLDGLGYSEVLSLADLSTAAIEEYRAAKERSTEKSLCNLVGIGGDSPWYASRTTNRCDKSGSVR